MKHTKEPWTTKIRQPGTMLTIESTNEEYVCSLLGDEEYKQANAERIVSCVNALEGLNPEAIAELVEAAEETIGAGYSSDPQSWSDAHDRLQQALEKVKA